LRVDEYDSDSQAFLDGLKVTLVCVGNVETVSVQRVVVPEVMAVCGSLDVFEIEYVE
jgi:hypothetical protein